MANTLYKSQNIQRQQYVYCMSETVTVFSVRFGPNDLTKIKQYKNITRNFVIIQKGKKWCNLS